MASTTGTPTPGLRARLFLLSAGLTVAAVAAAHAYASHALSDDDLARGREQAEASSQLVTQGLAPVLGTGDVGRYVERASQAIHGRVSVVPPGERAVDTEVATARTRGESVQARESDGASIGAITVSRRVMGPGGAWVIQVAVPWHAPSLASRAIRRSLAVGVLLELLAAGLLASVGVWMLTRPVRELTSTARMMVRDLSVRTRLHPNDEVGTLASALDELADGLTSSLSNLEHERDRLEAILEAMAEGVLVTDREGSILVANRAMREMFYVGRDVIGQAPIEAFRNADLHDAIAESTRSRGTVERNIAIDGVRPRTVLARLAPIDDGTGGTVAVLTDMTELRRLETIRRDFVANVSHELRTPIAAVRAAVETLQSGALDDPKAAAEFVSIIDRHAMRLHQIVEDLLELSRLEARELKLTLEAVEIGPMVDRVIDLLQLAAGKKKIRLQREFAEPLPRARADARALEQILSNLIDNAIKYSPEARVVTVRAGKGPRGVRITVEDNGAGIDARHLSRLFERFYRVDPGRSRQVGGTGLGLAIVKHLCEAIEGAVSVESVVGRGSKFHVDLRIDEAVEEPSTAA